MLRIYDLKTEYLLNPLGIDEKRPRFSWKLESTEKNVMQTAYRIVVYSGEEQVWDSQEVRGDESQRIRYQGTALKSRQHLTWKVEVQAGGEKAVSQTAEFEMGLLAPEDWKAKWIEPEGEIDIDKRKPSPYLRREFHVKKGLNKARIYQTAHGIYEFWMNGHSGTPDILKPGFTSYYKRIQYQAYDITELLREGMNVWAVILGDGWWRGVTGGTLNNNFGYKLHFFGQIELTYEDGSIEIIGSDERFKTASGGLLASDMIMGDIFDANLEPEGWKYPGFDDTVWRAAHLLDIPADVELIASRSVPVREKEQFSGNELTDKKGKRILDFGQNLAGYVKIRLRGCRKGQKITLTFGEDIKEGCFSVENCNKAVLPMENFQQIIYICSGKSEERYCPMFSFFGYRYMKIKGYSGRIYPEDMISVAIYSDMEETGRFTCSNPLINQLVSNSRWSQKSNFADVATDCPTREKNAWTGDNQIYVRTATDFMNVYTFYEKWLLDMKAEQYESGKIGITFPSTSSCHNPEEFSRKAVPLSALAGPSGEGSIGEDTVGWGDAAVWIPYMVYLCYGDKKILENQYETAKKYVDYELSCAKTPNPVYAELPQYRTTVDGTLDAEYIYDTRFHYGEWEEPIAESRPGNLEEAIELAMMYGKPVVATAYMFRSCKNLAHMAEILGITEDAEKYSWLAKRIKTVYNKYLIPEDGVIEQGHQAPYVRILAMGLCAEDKKAIIVKQLIKEIEDNDYKLNTGFLSTPFLLQVLAAEGYQELAFRILEQTESPGWLHPVLLGSTTILEQWDGMDRHEASFNHYSYGSVCEFLFGNVAGIQPDFEHPGYRHFQIKPTIGGNLTWAKASYVSLYGTIASEWEKTEEGIMYRFVVPVNTTAEIVLPDGTKETVGSGTYCMKREEIK